MFPFDDVVMGNRLLTLILLCCLHPLPLSVCITSFSKLRTFTAWFDMNMSASIFAEQIGSGHPLQHWIRICPYRIFRFSVKSLKTGNSKKLHQERRSLQLTKYNWRFVWYVCAYVYVASNFMHDTLCHRKEFITQHLFSSYILFSHSIFDWKDSTCLLNFSGKSLSFKFISYPWDNRILR